MHWINYWTTLLRHVNSCDFVLHWHNMEFEWLSWYNKNTYVKVSFVISNCVFDKHGKYNVRDTIIRYYKKYYWCPKSISYKLSIFMIVVVIHIWWCHMIHILCKEVFILWLYVWFFFLDTYYKNEQYPDGLMMTKPYH